MSNLVAIVGRPNVGKSTLFNRLTESRKAIVDGQSGVTRDRHYGLVDWIGKTFSLVDTGGYVVGSEDIFEEEIRKQVNLAIEEADVILFVLDVMEGITDMDKEVASLLRRSKKKIYVVANKVDNSMRGMMAAEFYSLGLGEVYHISSINGAGTGELLDDVVSNFEENKQDEVDENIPRITIVGRPNAGKSSILNVLLGKDRSIVTSIAGTTRDTIDTHFTAFNKNLILVDTAGLRKKGKVHEDLEFYSVMRSIRAIENSDVCVLILDATLEVGAQDLNILHLIEKNSKGLVIVVNKWDLVEKDSKTMNSYIEEVKEQIAPFTDVPIIFTSVPKKQRILEILEKAIEVHDNKKRRITTSQFNEVMLPILDGNPPPATKGKFIKIKFCMQLPTHSPAFAFYANLPQYIYEPYKRFVENQLRKQYNFSGVPIKIFFRKK
jgi:GTPase